MYCWVTKRPATGRVSQVKHELLTITEHLSSPTESCKSSIPSPMCSCGEAEQDTSHILQTIQEPSGIGIRDLAITNNTPGEALWIRGCPTDDHQIRSGSCNPSVSEKKKKKPPVLIRVRVQSLVFCVLLSIVGLFSFFFDHCIVYPSSNYVFFCCNLFIFPRTDLYIHDSIYTMFQYTKVTM